jgi:hypothetical protein
MHSFEEIKPGARLRGLDPAGIAEVVQVARFGPDALNLVFRVDGRVGERLVYRGEESGLEFLDAGRSYAFDADGGLLRLASEAYRIRLAYLFDPYLAVSASQPEELSCVGETAHIVALWHVRWHRYANLGNSIPEDTLDSLARRIIPPRKCNASPG